MTTYYIKSDVIRKRPEWKQKEIERRIGDPKTVVVSRADITAEAGRKAWEYLHTTDDPPEVAIPKFEAMIPSYGCSCKNDYLKLKEQHPFDYSSPDAFFVSGVVLHNAVNRKLGKAEMGLDEARGRWGRHSA